MKKNRSLPTLLGYALAFSALTVISPTVEYEIGADGVSSDISIFSQMQAAEMRARARSAGRAKEVGMRKVAGAFRSQLIIQFLSESVVLSLVALVIENECIRHAAVHQDGYTG